MPRTLKRCVKSIARSNAFDAFVRLLESLACERPNLLHVLTYHRIDLHQNHPELNPRTISASPREFRQQMRHLARHFHVMEMRDAMDAILEGHALPPRSVLVTFDDGYRDLQQYAWPILKRLGLPATVFVATAYPDQPERVFWWDRLHRALHSSTAPADLITPAGTLVLTTPAERSHACYLLEAHFKRVPNVEAERMLRRIEQEVGRVDAGNGVLGWSDLRHLASEGLTVCPHTQTHRLLNRISIEEVHGETTGSLRDLKRELGDVVPALSYPDGQVNDQVAKAVGQLGVKVAFTTRRGVNDIRQSSRFHLRRINVGQQTSTALLRAQLLPCARWLNSLVA